MSAKAWLFRRPWSGYFGLSLLLTLGTALILALASIALIMLSPLPFDFPLSTFEVARMLKGEAVIRGGTPVTISYADHVDPSAAPFVDSQDPLTQLFRAALIRQMQVAENDLVFALVRTDSPLERHLDLARVKYEQQVLATAALYQDPHFNPLIFVAFQAGVRQPDGNWRMVTSPEPGPQWQWGLSKWILLMLLLMLPIAWIFSIKLARPIAEFAKAAQRIGHGSFEHVAVPGPSEIQLAASALNEMQTRLQGYVKERTAMIAAIAHDLRTPLARLSFLLANAPAALRDRAQSQIHDLDRMIANTLDFVRNEHMQLACEALDLRLLLESIVDDHIDLAQDVALAPGPSLILYGDAQVLRRLFANVIENALKYGAQARLSVERIGAEALVRIIDRGPGISEADRAHVFEPFYRGEPSRNRATGGAGLGLTIVQAAVRAHGGTIALRNLNPGLEVLLRLPIAQA
jgi:two-component system, OmpR family, sensor kinase